jgi:hypothetical protein
MVWGIVAVEIVGPSFEIEACVRDASCNSSDDGAEIRVTCEIRFQIIEAEDDIA